MYVVVEEEIKLMGVLKGNRGGEGEIGGSAVNSEGRGCQATNLSLERRIHECAGRSSFDEESTALRKAQIVSEENQSH